MTEFEQDPEFAGASRRITPSEAGLFARRVGDSAPAPSPAPTTAPSGDQPDLRVGDVVSPADFENRLSCPIRGRFSDSFPATSP